jgi:NTE family protein
MMSDLDPDLVGRSPRPRTSRLRSFVSSRLGRPGRGTTAFVLAGGGTRGAVQVGMLSELVDRGIRPDRVFGASVGAVNAAAYCADPTVDGVKKMEDVWMNLRPDDIFPKARVHGPWTFFQQRQSVYANNGLRKVLESGISVDQMEDVAIPLEVVTTSLADGSERWISGGPIVDAVLASAAIPGIFPPVEIDGELLIDGGVVNNVPIARAMASGATKIYVLLCGPIRQYPRIGRRPIESVISAFFTSVNSRFSRELNEVPKGVELVVFAGSDHPVEDFRDFGSSLAMVEGGRQEVRSVLAGDRAPSQPGGGVS